MGKLELGSLVTDFKGQFFSKHLALGGKLCLALVLGMSDKKCVKFDRRVNKRWPYH